MSDFATAVGSTFPWHEVYGGPTQGFIDFYTKALGWETTEMPNPDGSPGHYKMFKVNGQGVAGILGTENPGMENIPPHWSVYTAVDNVDARLAKCQELGATVVHGPMDVPTVGRMVLIKDPFGAMIWLFQMEMPAS
jgi:predicted enzyme related to lactoylglutathione lyase